jgi:hypothetical protein
LRHNIFLLHLIAKCPFSVYFFGVTTIRGFAHRQFSVKYGVGVGVSVEVTVGVMGV